MSEDPLDRLKGLCEEATPGPWSVRIDPVTQKQYMRCGKTGRGSFGKNDKNLPLIAASRTALPVLLEVVEKVGEMHKPRFLSNCREDKVCEDPDCDQSHDKNIEFCGECWSPWPCPTARLLQDALGRLG